MLVQQTLPSAMWAVFLFFAISQGKMWFFFMHMCTIPCRLAGAMWLFNMITIPIKFMLTKTFILNKHCYIWQQPNWELQDVHRVFRSPWRVWVTLLLSFCHPRDMIHFPILGSLTRSFLSCVSPGKNGTCKSVQWNSVPSFSWIFCAGKKLPYGILRDEWMNLFSSRFNLISNRFRLKIWVFQDLT